MSILGDLTFLYANNLCMFSYIIWDFILLLEWECGEWCTKFLGWISTIFFFNSQWFIELEHSTIIISFKILLFFFRFSKQIFIKIIRRDNKDREQKNVVNKYFSLSQALINPIKYQKADIIIFLHGFQVVLTLRQDSLLCILILGCHIDNWLYIYGRRFIKIFLLLDQLNFVGL